MVLPRLRALLMVGFSAVWGLVSESRADCLGPPYLWVTFHGGNHRHSINNIYKYSRDGCFLGEAIDAEDEELMEPRGLLQVGDKLFLANAYWDKSFIAEYTCGGEGMLSQSRVVVPEDTDGLVHPYGLVADSEFLYVTVQDTNSMLRFHLHNGQPAPYPTALHEKSQMKPPPFSPGTFVQFEKKYNDVRGVAMDHKRDLLWVANKKEGVLVVERDGGFLKATLDAGVPIAVHYCKYNDKILVGDKDSDWVLMYDPDTLEQVGHFSDRHLRHPTGIACHDDGRMYVISQSKNIILEFDLDDPSKRGYTVIDLPDDDGEGLMLSSMC